VVHCADSGLERSEEEAVEMPAPFFLAPSMTNPRKNIACLLRGFKEFRMKNPACALAITGRREWIDAEMNRYGREGVHNLGFVRDGQLRYLYRNCSGLIYPSRDEGFGLPLMDAFRAGCPVFCSDIPVFHEVMGDGATYFNPDEPGDLADKLTLAGTGAAGQIALPENYSWDQAAETLIGHAGRP
jgi:glycosyltransferase involved in cell wall biosynthesis